MCTSFSFDDAEFEEIIHGWRQARERLQEVRHLLDDVHGIRSRRPADDPATRMFLDRAWTALAAADSADRAMRAYAEAFAANLRETRGTYGDTDDGNTARMTTIAGQTEGTASTVEHTPR